MQLTLSYEYIAIFLLVEVYMLQLSGGKLSLIRIIIIQAIVSMILTADTCSLN